MKFTYPSELPVSAARDDYRQGGVIKPGRHRLGKTGSGKTTQLPKILLELEPRYAQ